MKAIKCSFYLSGWVVSLQMQNKHWQFISFVNNQCVNQPTINSFFFYWYTFCKYLVYIITNSSWFIKDDEDIISFIKVLSLPFLCSTDHHLSSFLLATVHWISSSMMGIGWLLFICSGCFAAEERAPTCMNECMYVCMYVCVCV